MKKPASLELVKRSEEEDDYAHALAEAMEGDESSARQLLHGFLSAVEQGKPIPAPILHYLYSAFAAYLQKREPKERPGPLEHLLFLARGRGQPQGSKIRVQGGRIYTDVAIAALFNILLKRGMTRAETLARLGDEGPRQICPARTVEQYVAENNALPDWTATELRRLIRDEREGAKSSLTAEHRDRLAIQKSARNPRK